jgi:hypothetical protein
MGREGHLLEEEEFKFTKIDKKKGTDFVLGSFISEGVLVTHPAHGLPCQCLQRLAWPTSWESGWRYGGTTTSAGIPVT